MAWAVVAGFVTYLQKRGLLPFGGYRVLVGTLVFLLLVRADPSRWRPRGRGVLFVGGTLMGVLGPAPEKVKSPIRPSLTITDGTGTALGHDVGTSKRPQANLTRKLEPGTYTINVRDAFGDKLKSGYSFHFDIARAADAPAQVASANLTGAEVPANAPVEKAADTSVKAGAVGAVGAKVPAALPGAKASPAAAKATPAPANAAAGKPEAKPAVAVPATPPGDCPAPPGKPGAGGAPVVAADAKK